MRKTITATEGHVLTNGKTYGRTIHLAEGMDASAFHEITAKEYEAMFEESSPEVSPDDATEDDYIAALNEMGVNL